MLNNNTLSAHTHLTAEWMERFSRMERMIGITGLERLADATVLLLGLGGVGSSAGEALARGGIGHFIIVDCDSVELSNINRQAIAFQSTLGKRKTDVMAHMIHHINPQAEVHRVDKLLLCENLEDFLSGIPDITYCIDAIDAISVKLLLAEYAQAHQIPLVSAMGAANKVHPEYLRFADIHQTQNCPLCRIMRREARKRGITHLNVLYSSEKPAQVSVDKEATRKERSNLGTLSYMPPIMGQMIAGYVIREIAGNTLAR